MPFCEKCGTQMDDNAKFCPSCGAPVAVAPVQETVPPTQQQAAPAPQQAVPPVQETVPPAQGAQQTGFAAKVQGLNNTPDTTAEFDPNDISQNKAMAILSYIGILVLVPIFGAKNSKFARFHANQGLVLLLTDVAYGILSGILTFIKGLIQVTKTEYLYGIPYKVKATPWFVSVPIGIVTTVLGIAITVLVILGIVNAATGKAKELPLIGKIKLLK